MRKYDKVPATIGQIGEITGALVGEMNFSKDEAKAIIGKLGPFRRNVRRFYSQYRNGTTSDFSDDLARWIATYQRLFSQTPDLSGIRIPAKPENVGPVRLIVAAHELMEWTGNRPLQGTQDVLKKHFPCWQYNDNLDTAIPTNDRHPKNGSYAVWVRDVREADEEFANKSANDLAAENHTGIVTLERQLMEADVFFEGGEHLDQQNVTLCSGSRYRDGRVPHADWSGKFFVGWCSTSRRPPFLRSRRVWA